MSALPQTAHNFVKQIVTHNSPQAIITAKGKAFRLFPLDRT